MFKFYAKKFNLISHNQSGFAPCDSCINQLLSIIHEIYKSFDDGLDICAVTLDISKAFNKIWHKGLLNRLTQNGISGNLSDIISDFLNSREQRVVLNGQFSAWTSIDLEVLQGSIIGSLLLLIYINDLSDDLVTNIKLFADTSLFPIVNDMNRSASNLNNDLSKISDWAMQWKISFNPNSSKQAQEVIFCVKLQNSNHDSIYFNHNLIQ